MDAAKPLTRWLRTAGLVALTAGCADTSQQIAPAPPVARPQAPAGDPLPPVMPPTGYAPAAPVPPSPPVGVVPATPAGPVAGSPVAAGFTPGGAGVLRSVAPPGVPSIRVVAMVGTGGITDQEVWEAVRQRMGEYLQPTEQGIVRDEAKEKAIYQEELRRVIERELILDEMYATLKKAGKMAVVDEIKRFAAEAADRQLRDFRKMYKVASEQELQEKVFTPQGLTLPVIRRQIERQMMADEYVRNMIKDKGKGAGLAETREYYDKHQDEFRTEDRVKWLHIFVSVNRFGSAREAYDYALAIQQNAAAGAADFRELVKKYDQGLASGRNGEGLGTKRGEIQPPEVEPAVWGLRPGQVSGLIESPTGYHIVMVTEREDATVRPLDDKMQDLIRKKLMRQRQEAEYKALVERLWRRGVVRVMPTPTP